MATAPQPIPAISIPFAVQNHPVIQNRAGGYGHEGPEIFDADVTFNGNRFHTAPPVEAYTSIAAAGTNQATGTVVPLTVPVVFVTAADGTKGVTLKVADYVGRTFKIFNTTGSTLPIYPILGGTFNGGSANAAFNLTTLKYATLIASDTVLGNYWIA